MADGIRAPFARGDLQQVNGRDVEIRSQLESHTDNGAHLFGAALACLITRLDNPEPFDRADRSYPLGDRLSILHSLANPQFDLLGAFEKALFKPAAQIKPAAGKTELLMRADFAARTSLKKG